MISQQKPQAILRYIHAGFLALLLLSWANELLDLPGHIFAGPTQLNWREALMENVLTCLVWGLVYRAAKKMLTRLFYLEGFLRVCAWCRKVNHEDQWLPVEQYFAKGFDIQTSHGICPVCSKNLEQSLHAEAK